MNVVIKFFRDLFKFVYSKIFLIQLVIAVTMLAILSYVALEWLESTTNHHQRIIVPSLSKKNLDDVEKILEEKDLRYEVQDSATFNPDYPRYSVVEQNPAAGSEVKEKRKIYITINPSGYRKIEVPNVVLQTRRQAEPKLIALGFKVGTITYKPNMSDQVLELRHKGKRIKAGTMLMKTSTIDLVVGDGKGLKLNLSN
ncbi:PASTA domain-containing protein [Aquimarina sp. AD10]|uniref:Serine/threonine protein kinase n=1 Tax=Aquimarina aggregata TaxID=1642818 RepID=A0A163AFA3_9FLAO|nr:MULTISPECIES: PASTA domain-containing protein [Aquimarina]AXT63170.1 PASTA domain-containing protein [Aquimarina sp. AD10]KZS40505.1 serine/threonine protein kinase [Aquimarina aggregata]RKM98615.1 PASTA domain-containing protein [Aquimarina sp. AD10]